MSKYLMGIDYGTGGAKACIIDAEGTVLSYAFREYPIVTAKPGWSEHDPHLYWQVAKEIINECVTKARIDPRDIRCIGTSSALPSMVMVDEAGDPIGLAYNLMDRRATEQVKWIQENIGDERIFELTGNRLSDHPVLVDLMWEKSNRPESFARVDKVLTIDGFIRLKLSGKATMNYGAGGFYGVAWDIRRHCFDHAMLEKVGIDSTLLPSAFPSEAIVGEVTGKAASETGLFAGTPLCAGSVDCNAGWVSGGAIGDGDIQINLGTCGVLGVVHKKKTFENTMIACAYTVDSADTYVTIGCTTTGGHLLRYVRDNFSPVETETERVLNVSAYDLLNLEAERVRPGSDGLVVLPYLMGERTPLWDVDARGVVFGLSLSHTKGHMVRAMMESVAYALYHSFEVIRAGIGDINYPIVLNEGGARSRLWRKIITDVFDVPTTFLENRVGAPYGDAILAGVATGVFKDFGVAREFAQYVDPLEPSPRDHEIYMDHYGIYRNLYEHLKGDFKDLAELRRKHVG